MKTPGTYLSTVRVVIVHLFELYSWSKLLIYNLYTCVVALCPLNYVWMYLRAV